MTALAVVHLVAGIFPHFADDGGLWILTFCSCNDFIQHNVVNFVNNVQTPTIGTLLYPVANDAVLATKVTLRALASSVYPWQSLKVPPALVAVVVGKVEPITVRAGFVVVCAPFAVLFVLVEVTATATHVVKHAVQNYLDTQLVRFGNKVVEIFFRAEHWVDNFVIFCVVLVVAVRLEYWV